MDANEERNKMITLVCCLALGALCLLSGFLGRDSGSPENTDGAACRHWSNIRGDIADGVLTTSEARAKLGEVRDLAESSEVRSAATRMLSGVTLNDAGRAVVGMSDLDGACR